VEDIQPRGIFERIKNPIKPKGGNEKNRLTVSIL
jgi:hypothetical protein